VLVSLVTPTDTIPSLALMSSTPYGIACPRSLSLKS